MRYAVYECYPLVYTHMPVVCNNDNYQYHIPARQHWKVKNRSVGHHKRLDSQSQLVATSTRFATKYTILSPKNTYDLRVKGHTILIFIFSVNSVLS